MLRALFTTFCLLSLFTQVVLAAHPFSVKCQNTGEVALSGTPPLIKKCCDREEHHVVAQEATPQIKCCIGFNISIEAVVVERTRDNLTERQQPTPTFLLPIPSLRFGISPKFGKTHRLSSQEPPPGQPSTLRSTLGSWTC